MTNGIWSKKNRKGSKVQTIMFDKDHYTLRQARKWLKDNDFKDIKVDETEEYYRFRQLDPSKFVKKSFRTINFTSTVKAVVGIPKGKRKSKKKNPQIRKNIGEFSRMMFGHRVNVYSDAYSIDGKHFPYDRNDPKTFRFLDLYSWFDSYFPDLIDNHIPTSFDKREMAKKYNSMIFAPDRRAINMNYHILDRIEKDNEINDFISYLLDGIQEGILQATTAPKIQNNPRKDTNFIQEAFQEMEEHGTEGAFTRYVADNYKGKNTPEKRKKVAQEIKRAYEKWVDDGKQGRRPHTLTTYRRAVFYLNLQKRSSLYKNKKKNPKQLHPMDADILWKKWYQKMSRYGYKAELLPKGSYSLNDITIAIYPERHQSYNDIDELMGDRVAYVFYNYQDNDVGAEMGNHRMWRGDWWEDNVTLFPNEIIRSIRAYFGDFHNQKTQNSRNNPQGIGDHDFDPTSPSTFCHPYKNVQLSLRVNDKGEPIVMGKQNALSGKNISIPLLDYSTDEFGIFLSDLQDMDLSDGDSSECINFLGELSNVLPNNIRKLPLYEMWNFVFFTDLIVKRKNPENPIWVDTVIDELGGLKSLQGMLGVKEIHFDSAHNTIQFQIKNPDRSKPNVISIMAPPDRNDYQLDFYQVYDSHPIHITTYIDVTTKEMVPVIEQETQMYARYNPKKNPKKISRRKNSSISSLKQLQDAFYKEPTPEFWDRLKILLFSEDKENVILGMDLLERLEEPIYYVALATLLQPNGNALISDIPTDTQDVVLAELLRNSEKLHPILQKSIIQIGLLFNDNLDIQSQALNLVRKIAQTPSDIYEVFDMPIPKNIDNLSLDEFLVEIQELFDYLQNYGSINLSTITPFLKNLFPLDTTQSPNFKLVYLLPQIVELHVSTIRRMLPYISKDGSYQERYTSIQMPKSIGYLTNLEQLIASNHQNERGNMGLTSLPESIGNLSKLRYLNVNQNSITSFPSSMANLKSLQSLFIGYQGTNPTRITTKNISAPNLETIILPESISSEVKTYLENKGFEYQTVLDGNYQLSLFEKKK